MLNCRKLLSIYGKFFCLKVISFLNFTGAEPVVPAVKPQGQFPSKLQETVKPREVELKDPPAEFEFIADPPSISAFDLDIVKLTAQFVARNGRQFLTNLMNKEQRNYQFDFLRPQHSLFNYFTKLVEQYTKILIPPKDLKLKLIQESNSPRQVLDQVKYRVLWQKHVEAQKRAEEEQAERERVSYAQIDWHDFVVVETVDFQQGETGNFPPPTTPEEVGMRVIAQERFEEYGDGAAAEVEMEVASDDEGSEDSEGPVEHIIIDKAPGKGANTEMQDMEEDSDRSEDEEDDRPPRPPSPPVPPPPSVPPKQPPLPPQPPLPNPALVKKDYNPKAGKPLPPTTSDQWLISPITGEKIPAHKMQDHIRIGLLQEQKQKAAPELQEEVFAAGGAIESSLKHLAERRTDIFGIGGEETMIGKKIGEEERKQDEKVTWDGHTASMESTSRAARAHITIEEQIAAIHKIKGLLPDEEKEKIGPSETPKSVPQPRPPSPPSALKINVPTSAPPPPQPPRSQPPAPPSQPPKPQQPMPAPPVRPPLPQQQQQMPRPPMPPAPQMMPRPPMMMMTPQPSPMPPMMAMHQMRPQQPMGMHHGFMQMQHQQAPPQQPPQVPQRRPAPMPSEDEPSSKKVRTEESLIAEGQFLARAKNPNVPFMVMIPKMTDKPEWKLNGQALTFTLPLTDTVSVIKAKIFEEIAMPAGKQKLQYDGLFIKDSNSLAYYNFNPGCRVQLQLKERGGRKK